LGSESIFIRNQEMDSDPNLEISIEWLDFSFGVEGGFLAGSPLGLHLTAGR